MKKIISNLVIIASITLLVPGYSTAQNSTSVSYATSGKQSSPDELGNEGTPAKKTGFEEKPDKASIKAMKANLKAAQANFRSTNDFNKNYTDATDVVWAAEKDLIVVSFKMGALPSRSVYDRKGNRIYTVLNYYEDDLSDDIRELVKRNYRGLSIKLVQEILQDDKKVYKIHLEDTATIKQILVCNGEITEYRDFKKTP